MNKRFENTENAIRQAVFTLLEKKSYDKFSIKDVCDVAGINRTSFYLHYQDINDMMVKIESDLAKQLGAIFEPKEINSNNSFVELFKFIKENKIFYKAFLKSHAPSFAAPTIMQRHKDAHKKAEFANKYNYADWELEYHLRFFGAGLRAVCEHWVMGDCKESPETMAKVIFDEYANNAKYFERE